MFFHPTSAHATLFAPRWTAPKQIVGQIHDQTWQTWCYARGKCLTSYAWTDRVQLSFPIAFGMQISGCIGRQRLTQLPAWLAEWLESHRHHNKNRDLLAASKIPWWSRFGVWHPRSSDVPVPLMPSEYSWVANLRREQSMWRWICWIYLLAMELCSRGIERWEHGR